MFRAVGTPLAIAASGGSPQRSISVNSASALITTARSRRNWARASGLVRRRAVQRDQCVVDQPEPVPGPAAAAGGLVMEAEIIARTAPWLLSMPRNRNSAA